MQLHTHYKQQAHYCQYNTENKQIERNYRFFSLLSFGKKGLPVVVDEYVLTTHIDKGHVHNHIIFCAVNFVDHRKYNSNKRSYYGIRNISGRLCRENGLSIVVPSKGSKGKSYTEYQAEKNGTSWKGKLKIAVDALIPQVSDFEELLSRL